MPSHLPDVFTAFRKRVEGLNEKMVRPVLPEPSNGKWPPFPELKAEDHSKDAPFALHDNMDVSELIKQLIQPLVDRPVPGDANPSSVFHQQKHTVVPFIGGESAALERLDHYMGAGGTGEHAPAVTYKNTRNGLVGADYSTKFSPYLTFGCLSARQVAARCDELEDRLREAGKLDDAARKNIYWIK